MTGPLADDSFRKIGLAFLWSSIALAAVLVTGTVGYRLFSPQTSWFDCFYMTFITIATIGYGEIVDMTNNPGARMFTVLIAFTGIAITTYIMSVFTAFLIEGRINAALWRSRMEKNIHKLRQHYIVCGVGRVGHNVANELAATRRPYIVIDEAMPTIEAHLQRHPGTMYIHGDACDDDVLIKGHIETARGVFAVTGDDSRNLLITITAKQLNPQARVVARCHEVRNIEKIRKAGADAIVSPDFTGGLRIASAMIRPHVVTFLDEMLKSDEDLRVEEIPVPSGFIPATLESLHLRSEDYIVLAVRNSSGWIFNPGGTVTLRPRDTLVVMANPEGRVALESLFAAAAA
ncbi:MAG TPA: NAD-binding protein [Burkholderiales bacterium]|nr:NAD-binding protein [Burkholderiales bacterium]